MSPLPQNEVMLAYLSNTLVQFIVFYVLLCVNMFGHSYEYVIVCSSNVVVLSCRSSLWDCSECVLACGAADCGILFSSKRHRQQFKG